MHPCTREIVFSLATCGSLFVLGSWSLVGCSTQAKTNEQRMAQRRNANPAIADKKQAEKMAALGLTNAPTNGTAAVTPTPTGSNNGVQGNNPNSGTNGQTSTWNGSTANTTLSAGHDAQQNTLIQMASYRQSNAVSDTMFHPQGYEEVIAQASTADRLASKPQLHKTYLPSGRPVLVDPSMMADCEGTTDVAFDPNASSTTQNTPSNRTKKQAMTPQAWTGSTTVATNDNEPNAGNNTNDAVATAKTANNTNFHTLTYATPNQNWTGGPGSTNGATNAVASNANASNNTPSNTSSNTSRNGNAMELSQLLANAFAEAGQGAMDPLRVWFIYSSLAVSNPDIKLPEGWSNDLLPAERDRVMAAHAGFSALGRAFRDGTNNVDPGTRQALVAALTGEPALTIPKVDLCTKVVAYGDYSPINRRNFLAGSSSRVIVYSELDGFKSSLQNGKWTTRLATRVSILPSDSSSTAWSRSPEWTEVTDTCENPRNGFFLGEIIPIGSNLVAGSYNVKVEVKDLSTGNVTSSIVPFKVLGEREYAAASERGID